MVKIRLARAGAKKKPFYRVVVADQRARRDGRHIEQVGYFDPNINALKPERLVLREDRIAYWRSQGAQLSKTVQTLMKDIKRIPTPMINESQPADHETKSQSTAD